MDFFSTLDLFPSLLVILFVVTILFNLFLSFVVLFNDRTSATNIIYFCLSFCLSGWLIATFLPNIAALQDYILYIHRMGIVFAAPLSASFFLLAHTLPSRGILLSKINFIGVLILTFVMMVLNASPFAFTSLEGGTINPITGPGIIPFSIISTIFSLLAIFLLVRKSLKSKGTERKQLLIVLFGVFLMLLLITVTVLIPVVLYNSLTFVPLTPLYSLIFLSMTAYAITRYHLFDIKLLIAQSLTTIISIVLFAKIFISNTFEAKVIDSIIFIVFSGFGLLLIQNVKKEIRQREQIEKLATDLKKANDRLKVLDRMKTEFVSIASHQLRSPLTSIRGYASMLLEGSYGKLSKKATTAVERIADSSRYMALSVEDYLNVSRIEAGNMKYEIAEFNLRDLTERIVDEMRSAALKKGLLLVFRSDCDGSCSVKGDVGKIRQSIMNLIDNAMKYTEKGSITVIAHDDVKKKKMLVSVVDTGVGMSKETIEEVFHKFIRAKNANEINVTGTGLGLFVAKKMIEEMGGRIWAESKGVNKGSTFHIELKLLPGKAKRLPKN